MWCEIIQECEVEKALKNFNGGVADFHVCWSQNDENGVFLRDFTNHKVLSPFDTRMALTPFLGEKYHLMDAKALYYSPSHIYIAVYESV